MSVTHSFIPLSHLGFLAVTGQDAASFLQGQVTCDLNEVTETQSQLGAYCNLQGRIIASFRIFQWKSEYYLQMPKEVIAPTLLAFKKYAVFSKVALRDASEEIACLGVLGEKAIASLNISADTHVIKIESTPPRIEIIATPSVIEDLQAELQQQKITETNLDVWRLEDIRAGIPTIYSQTIGLFTPHDINYPALHGVSFNKGCYLGQEIVARMHYLGKLKQHLYRISLDTSENIVPGTALTIAEKNIGRVVDAVALTPKHYEALAVMQDKVLQESDVVCDQGQISTTVKTHDEGV
jgi:folate-binding protein YgfZ